MRKALTSLGLVPLLTVLAIGFVVSPCDVRAQAVGGAIIQTQPERVWMIATVFAGAFLIYGIGGLIWSAIKDHMRL